MLIFNFNLSVEVGSFTPSSVTFLMSCLFNISRNRLVVGVTHVNVFFFKIIFSSL